MSEKINIFENGAIRFNAEKLRIDLIPPELITSVSEVLTFGARKYGDRNWEKGMPHMDYWASCQRHLWKWANGEDIDADSGLLHLSHAGCNIAMMLHHINHHPNLDNRPCKQVN